MSSRRVIIGGGSGFVGSALVKLLHEKGYVAQVYCDLMESEIFSSFISDRVAFAHQVLALVAKRAANGASRRYVCHHQLGGNAHRSVLSKMECRLHQRWLDSTHIEESSCLMMSHAQMLSSLELKPPSFWHVRHARCHPTFPAPSFALRRSATIPSTKTRSHNRRWLT